ncbi:MAG: GNAT family N-acetyltransferase [Erythrobacter sp.]
MNDPSTDVTITHADQNTQQTIGGIYTAHLAGEDSTGTLEWEEHPFRDHTRIATHTIVPPKIGGRGIAGLLVERLIADARTHGFKIIPQCWYVKDKFDENPDWADVRA